MNTLDRICADKRTHIRRMEAQTPLSALEEKIKGLPQTHGFIKQIRNFNTQDKTALIAEVKKASPSKGVIREDFNPVQIAQTYENSGAACLSVLTDEPYFQGRDDFLTQIRAAVSLPLLRKDFMLEPYQIAESRALGADCILLIMAALSDETAGELYSAAQDYNLDTLIEVHNADELDRALKISPDAGTAMIGVNNRNLKTLDVDLQTGLSLAEKIPENITKVAESGIAVPSDIVHFKQAGYGAFLVGESLMRQDDIGLAVKNLLSPS